MDSIAFDTYLRTAASRNGWEVCEKDTDGDGYRLSSTAHEGLLHVLQEGEKFCIIPAMAEVQVVTREELGKTLRELVKTDTSPKGTPPLRTEREQMILARTAQHRYRNGLEALWGGRCACTGVGVAELLRASHAKPWKDCTDAERVDPYNGFLLEARYDALFDQGYISFTDEGELLISPKLAAAERQKLGLLPGLHIHGLSPRHLPYLHWHREHVFLGAEGKEGLVNFAGGVIDLACFKNR